ncbi:MAG: Dabb family protein [Acidobacteriota bacterium]|nr:Dabb family protein [Acidobacteriota bacterium]
MNTKFRIALVLVAILAVFSAGYAAGVNHFGIPKTVLHVVIIQWRPTATAEQKQAVIDGVRQMAASIPGIRNIWIKPVRMASLKWNAAFVIEFANRAAADRYATDPAHAAWAKLEEVARLDSLNVQVTN